MTSTRRFTLAFLILAFLAGLAGSGAPSLAQDKNPSPTITEDVSKEIERLGTRIARRPERTWTYAAAIRALEGENFDNRPILLTHASGMIDHESPHMRLVGSQILLGIGEEDDFALAYETLAELFGAGLPDDVVGDAARLVTLFPPFDPAAFAQPITVAIAARSDGTSPTTNVALATADVTVNGNELSVERLRGFLNSDDHGLVSHAALALAELGYAEEVRGRLAALTREAGGVGALARLSLEVASYETQASDKRNAPKNLVQEVVQHVYGGYVGKDFDYGIDTYALTPLSLVEQATRGLVSSLDNFSVFLTQEERNRIDEDNQGAFAGIGAMVQKGEDDPAVRVTRPIYSGPAYAAGLRSGDYLWETEIGDKARVSLVGLEVEDVVKLLRGPVGTKIRIWVKRMGVPDLVELTLTRQMVSVSSVYETLLPGGTGYVLLTKFAEQTANELQVAVDRLRRQGAKGLVLDLRDNPGGLLSTVLAVANKFLPKDAPIARLQGKWGQYAKPLVLGATKDAVWPTLPVVVLIDNDSASGSELLSGTLKEHKRALVIGEKSFGKGVGQGFGEVKLGKTNTGHHLKCTEFHYYIMPGEISINQIDGESGVTPTIEVHQPRLSSWEYYMLVSLRKSERIDQWVRSKWGEHKEAFMKAAEYDAWSSASYPGFDDLYTSLKTPLSVERVRNELRVVIRTMAADERAHVYPADYQNDYQLQRAIVELAKQTGTKIEEVDNYKPFLSRHR